MRSTPGRRPHSMRARPAASSRAPTARRPGRPRASGLGALQVFALAIDPVSPSTLYAGTRDNGIFKSVDGAATWTAASNGLTETRVFAIAVDPKTPSTLYAGTNGSGVFKSTDGAATWKAAAFTGTSFALAIDPVTPTTVYACANARAGREEPRRGRDPEQGDRRHPEPDHQRPRGRPGRRPRPSTSARQTAIFKSTNGGVNAQAANRGLTAVRILVARRRSRRARDRLRGHRRRPLQERGRRRDVDVRHGQPERRATSSVSRSSRALRRFSREWTTGAGGAPTAARHGRTSTPSASSTRGRWTPDRRRPSMPPGGSARPKPPQPRRRDSRGRAPTPASLDALRRLARPAPRLREHRGRADGNPTVIVGTDSGVYGILVHGDGGYWSGSRTTPWRPRSSTRSPWIRAPPRPSGRARTGGCSDRRTAA